MKILVKVGNWSKTHLQNEGKKVYFKGGKPSVLVNFGNFPCSWIRTRIQDSQINADLRGRIPIHSTG
jgi:hypothetical protein